MNYSEMGEKYSAEAERLKKRIEELKKREPRAQWEQVELARAINMMGEMYVDCYLTAKYLSRKAGEYNARM